jgi:hypothetical protein
MIAKENHHCVVAELAVVEQLQHVANEVIHRGDVVVIVRDVAPHFRRVWVIRRQLHLRRIANLLRLQACGVFLVRFGARSHLALVRDGEVDVREERFVLRQDVWVLRPITSVAPVLGQVEVEVGFPWPERRVAGLLEIVDEQRRRLEELRPHMVCADRGGVLTRDEAAATRRTNRRVREAACEACALRREAIKVRRDGVRIAIAAKRGGNVFRADPDDVRRRLRRRDRRDRRDGSE